MNKVTGAALPWNPDVKFNAVRTLAVDGNTVYVGGDFLSIGNNGPQRLAAVDAASGSIKPWAPAPGGVVLTVLPMGGWVYVGGTFDSIGGVSRQLVAGIDLATGLASSWDAQLSSWLGCYVSALAANQDSLFIGGYFFGIGGRNQSGLGTVRLEDGTVQSFIPDLSDAPFGAVLSGLCLASTNLIVTGTGNIQPPNEGCLSCDAVTGQRVIWSFNADGGINAFAGTKDILYVGGSFSHIAGEPRARLAAFDANTHQLLPWSPEVASN